MNDQPKSSTRSAVKGSERKLPHGCASAGDVDASAIARVSIVLRPKKPLPDITSGVAKTMSREEFAREHGASHEDIAAVEAFVKSAGLHVVESDSARRTIEVEGTVASLAKAFEANLSLYEDAHGRTFRGREGALTVPADVADIVRGVFGLDDRAQARAQFVRATVVEAAAASAGFTPLQIASAYGFPAGDGAGQTIGLIELGGGYAQSDLDTYFSKLQIATPPVVISVSVDGASNAPTGSADGPDAEVALDIEVAGSIAPGAKIVAYFAPNTDQGFLDAVTTAVHDTANAPNVISISWGGPESTWTAQATTSFDDAFAAAALLGITITCAAGDSGSSDGVGGTAAHVDFPASSPHALACGGTHLELEGETLSSETVWNDGPTGGATGGGISDVFALPDYQQNAGVPASANEGARVGRGVPDVAGNADPASGYRTLVDGTAGVVGGTSAVAPLWAALVARLNAGLGKPLGFINPQLYAASPSALRDITIGNNGAYEAGKGWDACTGLGTPQGAKLAALFSAPAATPPERAKSKH